MTAAGAERWTPMVSIVLPVRNEEPYIAACLERLLRPEGYPADRLEVLVVDGRSEDRTREVVARVQDAQHAPAVALRLLDNPDKTVPQALNIGIRAARGEVIVRLDGHTVPASDYVRQAVDALDRSGAANVGGVWVPVGETPFGRAVARATGHALGVGGAAYRFEGQARDVDTVPFGAFRRASLAKVGLFDESLVRNQDYEMNVRLREAGERVRLDPAIRFTYTPRGNVRALARQYFQYGWWKVETLRRHPGSLRPRQALPAAFVAFVALALLAAPFWWLARLALAAALLPYALVVGVVAMRLANEETRFTDLVGAFVTMHLSWGAGFVLNAVTGGRYPWRAGPARVPKWDGRVLPDQPRSGDARPATGDRATHEEAVQA